MADILSSVAKKRKEREEILNKIGNPLKNDNNTAEIPKKKKWLTRKEIEEAELKKRQEEEERERIEKQKEKSSETDKKNEEDKRNKIKTDQINTVSNSSNSKLDTSVEVTENGFNENEQKPTLPKSEVIRRLRARREPITLFGETDFKREQRLKILEAMDPEGEDRTELGRNDFAMALDEIEDQTEEDSQGTQMPTSNEFTLSGDMNREPENNEEKCLFFLSKLLKEWEETLNSRSEQVKKSSQGKNATATMKQTQKYISPLFMLLKNKTLPEDILKALVTIVQFCQKRDYIKANDEYLRLAIGNAPWPMGVTMVGIHERSAREKIFSKQVAHILNDETQRKYIQSVKRLMTFCQKKYPTDPSRCVG